MATPSIVRLDPMGFEAATHPDREEHAETGPGQPRGAVHDGLDPADEAGRHPGEGEREVEQLQVDTGDLTAHPVSRHCTEAVGRGVQRAGAHSVAAAKPASSPRYIPR